MTMKTRSALFKTIASAQRNLEQLEAENVDLEARIAREEDALARGMHAVIEAERNQNLKERLLILKVERIKSICARAYGVRVEEMVGYCRTERMTYPRQLAMYACRTLLGLTLEEVGAIFDKSHDLVIYTVKVVKGRMEWPSERDRIQQALADCEKVVAS